MVHSILGSGSSCKLFACVITWTIAYDGGMTRTTRQDPLEAQLKSAGLRATRQRMSLLKILEDARGPVAVEEITRTGRGSFDLATAYRTFDAFVLAGIARRIELAQGRALYELAADHHHHAVCTTCGRIADIDACLPRGIDARVRAASGFAAITDHSLEFFGTCAPCSRLT